MSLKRTEHDELVEYIIDRLEDVNYVMAKRIGYQDQHFKFHIYDQSGFGNISHIRRLTRASIKDILVRPICNLQTHASSKRYQIVQESIVDNHNKVIPIIEIPSHRICKRCHNMLVKYPIKYRLEYLGTTEQIPNSVIASLKNGSKCDYVKEGVKTMKVNFYAKYH